MWPNVEFRTQLSKKNLGLVRSSLQRTTCGWVIEKGPRTTTTKKYKEIGVLFHEYMLVFIQTFLHYSYTYNFRTFASYNNILLCCQSYVDLL